MHKKRRVFDSAFKLEVVKMIQPNGLRQVDRYVHIMIV